MEIKKESQLYAPVKKYFENLGYRVEAEVVNCDVVAIKNEELIIIELKTSFNLKLVYQAVSRQGTASAVYVCVPRPKSLKTQASRHMVMLARRLGIGLLLYSGGEVKVHLIAKNEGDIRKNYGKIKQVTKEMAGRTVATNINIGGTNNRKILTAYKEQAVHIVVALSKVKAATGAELTKQFGCSKNANKVMYNDAYGWFLRQGNGVYKLSKKGELFLKEPEHFEEIVSHFERVCNESMEKIELENRNEQQKLLLLVYQGEKLSPLDKKKVKENDAGYFEVVEKNKHKLTAIGLTTLISQEEIQIASTLHICKEETPKVLVEKFCCTPSTLNILKENKLGWFLKKGRKYALTEACEAFLKENSIFSEAVAKYMEIAEIVI